MDIVLEKDKKWQDFLVLIQRKIELQTARGDKVDKNTFNLKYKQLTAIFEDEDEIKEYLEYAEKTKELIQLRHISKQTTKDEKIPDEVFLVDKTPSNHLLTGKDFFEVKRYSKLNYYPEDLFIFEYNEKKIKELSKNEPAYKDWALKFTDSFFNNASSGYLIKIQKVLKIVLDELEIHKTNELIGNKVPIKKFEKEGIYFTDAEAILNKIDDIEVLNAKLNYIYKENNPIEPFYAFGITKNDLSQNLVWRGNPEIIKKAIKEINDKVEGSNKKEKLGLNFLPKIVYNDKTGIGITENKRFKFKNHQPEFRIFAEMYKNINNPIIRGEVLKISACKELGEDTKTYFINELTKKMRKRTGLTKDNIVNNNGDLTLVAEIIKNAPN